MSCRAAAVRQNPTGKEVSAAPPRRGSRAAELPSHPRPATARCYLSRPERGPAPPSPRRRPARRERGKVAAGPLLPQPAGRCSSCRGGGERRTATDALPGSPQAGRCGPVAPEATAADGERADGREGFTRLTPVTESSPGSYCPVLAPAAPSRRQGWWLPARSPAHWCSAPTKSWATGQRRGLPGLPGTGAHRGLQAAAQQMLIHSCNARIRAEPGSN